MAKAGTEAEHTTRFWLLLSVKPHIVIAISEYIKVREIGMDMVAGSLDECGFSAIDFLKNKCRSRIDTHLEVCMRAKLQRLLILQNFPFVEAFNVWITKGRYGAAKV